MLGELQSLRNELDSIIESLEDADTDSELESVYDDLEGQSGTASTILEMLRSHIDGC